MLGARAQTVRFPISPAASLVVNDLYFPLVSAPAAFWAVVRPDGGDIRVTTQDGTTQCAREIVGFDYANKCGSLFFAPGSGSAFYVCAGSGQDEPEADAAVGKYGVWESAAKGVWHENNLSDSTVNQRTLYDNGTTQVEGKIGVSRGFNGAYQEAETEAIFPYTLMCWVKMDSVTDGEYQIVEAARGGVGLSVFNGKFLFFDSTYFLSSTTVQPGLWYLVVATSYNGDGNKKLYINGALEGSGNRTNAISSSIRLGKFIGHPRDWPGSIDEPRLYSRALDANEIAQIYANQNDPAAFWTVGAAG